MSPSPSAKRINRSASFINSWVFHIPYNAVHQLLGQGAICLPTFMLHGWPQLQGHFPLSHSPEDSEVRIQRNEMERPSYKKLEWLGNRTHLLQYLGSMNIAAHQVPSCDLEVNFTSSDSQVQARQSRLATLSCFFCKLLDECSPGLLN